MSWVEVLVGVIAGGILAALAVGLWSYAHPEYWVRENNKTNATTFRRLGRVRETLDELEAGRTIKGTTNPVKETKRE